MSWKLEVETPRGCWSTNSQRFATEREASDAGRELLSRWMAPISSRAAETPDEPVNYRFNFDTYKSEMLPEGTITEKGGK